MPARSLRRRADAVVLRWQARLDSDWSDRTLPWLCAAGLFMLLALPILDFGGTDVDTQSATGRMLLTIMAAVAEALR